MHRSVSNITGQGVQHMLFANTILKTKPAGAQVTRDIASLNALVQAVHQASTHVVSQMVLFWGAAQ
jgi:hypothetical protein